MVLEGFFFFAFEIISSVHDHELNKKWFQNWHKLAVGARPWTKNTFDLQDSLVVYISETY